MKKAMLHTKVSVKLRKSERHDEWYLYLEAYPVFKAGMDKPQREREYLNRIVTTPMWDKSRPARLNTNGEQSFKPKRDQNGIIICRSKLDRETCIFADNVRNLRQHEYDNAELYSDADQAMADKIELGKKDFLEYFSEVNRTLHLHSRSDICETWDRVIQILKVFSKDKPVRFSSINLKWIEQVKNYLPTVKAGGNKKGFISMSTASSYFSVLKAALRQAFIDGYLDVDLAAKVKNISFESAKREYLTIEELNMLVRTPCDPPVLKRAALFSALTGLRHSDIMKMTWSELAEENGKYRLNFRQKKTRNVEYMPISEQAYFLCGERGRPEELVFAGLQAPSWINRPLQRWVASAGITKHITFHCFRHSYATNLLTEGNDIYTVSKMLGHTKVETTQIYAKVVDSKKEKAAESIKLDSLDAVV